MPKLFNINKNPLIIAGPCSAESIEQMQTVTSSLQNDRRVSMIRCGVWKPRTRPGGFEGYGVKALRWIATIRKELRSPIPFCCEVAQPHHIELCQQYGIEAVWIGARTSVNPFLMNELAAALRGSGLAVMVKNPVTADTDLWQGAIERILHAGITDVAAIHRGFKVYSNSDTNPSTTNNSRYRNAPLWEIPIELKRRMPGLPLLCDPSHIGGHRQLVAAIAQRALDLHFDGLMIEVHPHPAEALTDSQQQITPDTLTSLLDNLTIRKDLDTAPAALAMLREELDELDPQLLDLLGRRMRIAQQIGEIKRENNMPIFQPGRWEEVLQRQMDLAASHGLSAEFVKEIMEKIHSESLRQQ
ncbi:MAG: bifunctional 3-deoxy-7-phosphoheptulonate synthase/chorismate mutase type II [Bacteroidales bacterium]|nr:bifunctional 3-deoxy-7-phosphoheptulonate synthase/chorismate mutase type II [Bacteroidales bacterium]